MVFPAHLERCVQRKFRALQHAVLGCDHNELHALVEHRGFNVGDCENLQCRPIKDFDLFYLLLEDEIGVPLPVLLQVSGLSLLNMLLPHIAQKRFRVDFDHLLNVFEVVLREEAFLVRDTGPELLNVLVSACASEGEVVLNHLCGLIRQVNASLEACITRAALVVLIVIVLLTCLLGGQRSGPFPSLEVSLQEVLRQVTLRAIDDRALHVPLHPCSGVSFLLFLRALPLDLAMERGLLQL